MLRTSVVPGGTFQVGIHRPSYSVTNLREEKHILELGWLPDGRVVENNANFPNDDIRVDKGRIIYEILNPLPFRGCTYIDSAWAETKASDPESICIQAEPKTSLVKVLGKHLSPAAIQELITELPKSLLYDLAANSTDSDELVLLVRSCCRLIVDDNENPVGLHFVEQGGRNRPDIDDFELFETIANNPCLPDMYKEIMVLRPGIQGGSPIVGDYSKLDTRVFEYLRTNSYIPWGHFAANFAHNCIRYRIADLSEDDMLGVRHLYYQRTYVTLADKAGLHQDFKRKQYQVDDLEALRCRILATMETGESLNNMATLWGWNFGYDYSGSGYRLHASHQMIHQQYAMVPAQVTAFGGRMADTFCCGDLVADVIERYRQDMHSDFFSDYLAALQMNTRTGGGEGEESLVVWQDKNVMLFVPKAQVSQWELQLMVIADSPVGPVGNILEADQMVRHSMDRGMLIAQRVLAALGAKLVTSIEYSKRFGVGNGQRLLYSFLPKLPWSMGAFSEAQLRFICGHYPEDFASACRSKLADQQ